jgi:hypothetical protein
MSKITSDLGYEIDEFYIDPKKTINRTIALFGPSETGKTTLIKHCMYMFKDLINECIVVAPTAAQNQAYDGFVPEAFIHYEFPKPNHEKKTIMGQNALTKNAVEFLEKIWNRQEMRVSIYSKANNIEVMEKLCEKIKSKDCSDLIKKINKNLNEKIKENSQDKQMVEKITADTNKMKILIYKKVFLSNFSYLCNIYQDLPEDEQYVLKYINFNPKILVILDDCAAEIKSLYNQPIMRKFFYQGRHCQVTLIISCQDDTDLSTNFRKNIFVSMFTSKTTSDSYFSRETNKFPKEVISYVDDITKTIFQTTFRILSYIRLDSEKKYFYHFTSPIYDVFKFGSEDFLALSDLIKTDSVSIDKSNPFYDKFKI